MSMMNSLPQEELDGILRETLRLLSHEVVQRETDNPIGTALASFTQEAGLSVPDSQVAFIEMVGKFVAHVYGHGLALPQTLTPDQAQARALRWLELGYQGTHGNGVEAARDDAVRYGKHGMRIVLAALAEIIKDVHRQRYLHWVLKTRVEALPWHTKRDLTLTLIKRWGNFIDPEIVQLPVEELVPACAELIHAYAASNDALRQQWRSRQTKPNF